MTAAASASHGEQRLGLRTLLYSGPFYEDWTERCLSAIASHREDLGADSEPPLVLLPHDIQLEDYEPLYPVLHGEDADRALTELLSSSRPGPRRLVFIDLAPDALPGDDFFLPALRSSSRDAWPGRLTLVVAAPAPMPFDPRLFDRHLPLAGADPPDTAARPH